MIKIQINGHEDISFFVDTVDEAAEFVRLFQAGADKSSDLGGMSTPDAAVAVLRSSGREMTSSQIAYEITQLRGFGNLKIITQNVNEGLKRKLKRPNSRIEKNGRLWKLRTSEDTNELLQSTG